MRETHDPCLLFTQLTQGCNGQKRKDVLNGNSALLAVGSRAGNTHRPIQI